MKKPICFSPSKMSFTITRNREDFTLEYTQHYEYLPKKVADEAITALTTMLPSIGITEHSKLEKALKIRYSGTFFKILTIILPELLIHTEQDINKLTFIIKKVHQFLHEKLEFRKEWNEQVEKELTQREKQFRKNPLVV